MSITHDLEDITEETGAGGGGGGGTITGAQNVGTGEGDVYRGTTGTTLDIKTIKQGTGITVTNNANEVEIDCTITQGVTAGANIGNTGAGTAGSYASLAGTTLNFKRINQGANTTITEDASNIYIASAGGGGGGTIGGAITPHQVAYCNVMNEITGEAGFEYDDTINQMVVDDVKMKIPIADVRWFGATGDGVTDDTAAIQDAIDWVAAQGGGTVLFPVGTYQVVGQTGGDGDALQHGDFVDLVGVSMHASVINWAANGKTGTILNTTNFNLNHTRITNLTFSVSGTSTVTGILGGSTLIKYNSAICTFENLLFYRCDTGIRGDGTTPIGIFDSVFKNCVFSEGRNGLNTYGSGNTLMQCRFNNNTENGLVIGWLSGESMGGHHCYGCLFIANKYDLYVVGTAVRINDFHGCWFETSTEGIINIPFPIPVQALNFYGCTFQTNADTPKTMLDFSNAQDSVNIYNCGIFRSLAADDIRIVGNPANQRLVIKDCITYDVTASPTGTPAATILNLNGTPQSIATGSDVTVAWSLAAYDQESCFAVGPTYGYRVKYAGTYLVTARISWSSFTNATANPYVFVLQGATTRFTSRQSPASTTDISTIMCSGIINAAVNDAITVKVHHSDVGAVTIRGDADLTNLHVIRIC